MSAVFSCSVKVVIRNNNLTIMVFHEDEVNGDWTDEYVQFTKDGKNPFRADVSNGKIVRFKLEAGSSYIKTKNGHYVGYPARKLTREQNLKWTYQAKVISFAYRIFYRVCHCKCVLWILLVRKGVVVYSFQDWQKDSGQYLSS